MPVTRFSGGPEKKVQTVALVSKVAKVHVGGPTAPHDEAHSAALETPVCTVLVAVHMHLLLQLCRPASGPI